MNKQQKYIKLHIAFVVIYHLIRIWNMSFILLIQFLILTWILKVFGYKKVPKAEHKLIHTHIEYNIMTFNVVCVNIQHWSAIHLKTKCKRNLWRVFQANIKEETPKSLLYIFVFTTRRQVFVFLTHIFGQAICYVVMLLYWSIRQQKKK